MSNKLSQPQQQELLQTLKSRFEHNMKRHTKLTWKEIENKLKENPNKLFIISQMEKTGGEPDVVQLNSDSKNIIFVDCAKESPAERRSLCYDEEALNSRKEAKPKTSALKMASKIGIEILTEEEYRKLQNLDEFDLKTSSWVATPEKIRKLGGAIFCDRRYDAVFSYHNGAESYYAARGFRGKIIL